MTQGALINADGKVNVGYDPAAFGRQSGAVIPPRMGKMIDSRTPAFVQDAFTAIAAKHLGAEQPVLPPQPSGQPPLVQPPVQPVQQTQSLPQVPQPPVSPVAPVLKTDVAPALPAPAPPSQHQQFDPTKEGKALEGKLDATSIQTLNDVAASFMGTNGEPSTAEQFLSTITHEVDGRAVPLADIIAGFQAMPGAVETAKEREGLEAHYGQAEYERTRIFEGAMGRLAELQAGMEIAHRASSSPEAMDALLTRDPAEFQRQTRENEQARLAIENNKAEMTRQTEARGRVRQSDHEKWQANEQRQLKMKYPEWSDPTLGAAQRSEVSAALRHYGYSPQEADGIEDHRQIIVLRDAVIGRRVREKGLAVVKDAKERQLAAPVGQPGSRGEMLGVAEQGNAQREVLYLRAQQSGSLNDAADVLGSLYNGGV